MLINGAWLVSAASPRPLMPRVCYITRAARTGYTSSSSCLCQLPLGEEKLLAAGKTSCALSVQSGADRHAAELIQPLVESDMDMKVDIRSANS